MKSFVATLLVIPLVAAQFGWLTRRDHFVPANILSGIGVSREEMSDALLARRTELMIQSQTFSILRDPQALANAAGRALSVLTRSACSRGTARAQAMSQNRSCLPPERDRVARPRSLSDPT